jgi:hypothetical protein
VKKRITLWAVLALAGLTLAIFVEPTGVVRGWLRGEHFYRGRPTSYWRKKVVKHVYPAPQTEVDPQDDPSAPPFPRPYEAAAVPVLIDLLGDEDDEVRYWSCSTLFWIGPDASEAVPTLATMLRSDNLYDRRNAVHALAAIGPKSGAALPELIEALKEEDAYVNWHAAFALAELGPEAKEAMPALLDLLHSDRAKESYLGPGTRGKFTPVNDKVGDMASRALDRIGPEAAAKAGVP